MIVTPIVKTVEKVGFDTIEKKTMDIDDFLKLPPVPMQRFTEGRAKTAKVKKMLSGPVLPVHLDVALVELVQDCVYYGETYKKGYIAVVNGNTRAYYWKNGLSKTIPKIVHTTSYKVMNMDEVRQIYNTFDSPDSTEIKKEKLYGILSGMFDFQPKCSKLIKGEFLSALNISCHFLNSKSYNQPSATVDQLPFQVKEYIEEIKAFDGICKTPKNWDQALVSSALMALKLYGKDNKKLLDCFDRIDRRAMDTTVLERDGATHISSEWQTNNKFPNKGTNWDKSGGLKETVSFSLYWISKFMEDKKLSQLGYNWHDTAEKWFEEYNKMNNSLNQILQIA
jgi:hypothetical protein